MYPSHVIFVQHTRLTSSPIKDLVEEGFEVIFSPKHTLEELVAELVLYVQNKVNANPESYLESNILHGLIPRKIGLSISNPDDLHLSTIIHTKGKNLNFDLGIEYKEVILLGFIENKFMITSTESDIWNEFTEIIYLPVESGFEIKKIKLIE
jgi:hypothetical protein